MKSSNFYTFKDAKNHSKKPIPPGCVAWRASIPSPHSLFKYSNTAKLAWTGHWVLIVNIFSIFADFSGSVGHKVGGDSLYVPHTHFMYCTRTLCPAHEKMRELWKLGLNLLGTKCKAKSIKKICTLWSCCTRDRHRQPGTHLAIPRPPRAQRWSLSLAGIQIKTELSLYAFA